ncbi:MAG TPA: molecular chaperone HtpG [Candidatus Angelobacter sp.]|nr:molecular chaperone HtpG [Candidatus Angelobacter sp.]
MSTAPVVESLPFQAETTQLLHLMIHSLYTQREIFLRELISNASDALDRLRFEALTKPELVEDGHKYEIRIKPDLQARILTISDTGIGMSRPELIANIGTIARSGTQELRKRMKESQSAEAVAELIGQFGVGFYSAFMVADKVTIITRRAGETGATQWDSAGDGSYTLTEAEKAKCGTDIILHLKAPDAENGIEDYTDRWKLSMIVHKYSDFIAYPIIYEGPSQEPGETEEAAKEIKIETKTLNSMKPIWTRSRSEVSESDYNDFYKHLSNDWTEPLKMLPLKAEGTFEYEALLFIPSQAPYDLFYHGSESGLRLYARRVMVMDQCEDLLPKYLRFIKGVVDSSDLPLNISRQRLQQDRHITQIRKWLTRKVLEALSEMREKETEKYLKFWGQFGRAMKEGVGSDYENKEKLLPLLLFESSHDPKELTTLKAYVERMKPEQTEILYLTGESRKVIENSPHLEAPKQKNYEVLYLSDPVDELFVQHMYDFEGKHLKSVTKGKVQLGTEEEKKQLEEELKKKEETYKSFLEAGQKKLDQYVKQIRLSARLVGSPACLVTEEHEYSPHLERLLQKGKGGGPKQRRIMELNPDHPVITKLYDRFSANGEDPVVGNSIELLFELALVAEGSEIADPVRLNQLTLELLQNAV